VKLAQIILDGSSRQNDSPWGFQSVEHFGSFIIGGLQPVTYKHRQMRSPSSGGNLPSSHTISPIGGLGEDLVQPPDDTKVRRQLNWQYERSSLNYAVGQYLTPEFEGPGTTVHD